MGNHHGSITSNVYNIHQTKTQMRGRNNSSTSTKNRPTLETCYNKILCNVTDTIKTLIIALQVAAKNSPIEDCNLQTKQLHEKLAADKLRHKRSLKINDRSKIKTQNFKTKAKNF